MLRVVLLKAFEELLPLPWPPCLHQMRTNTGWTKFLCGSKVTRPMPPFLPCPGKWYRAQPGPGVKFSFVFGLRPTSVSALPLTSCLTLGRSLHLPAYNFLICEVGFGRKK